MSQFCCAIFLLGISSLATAANLTLIYEWNELDYEFPSEASRTQALQDGAFYPDSRFEPLDMAAYGTRIFLSLFTHVFGIPVSLVSLPTWRASSAPPKLTPVPSWDMYGKEGCNKIEVPKKLEVDSVGRMWILDDGSTDCNSKIWTIDLINDDQTKLVHRFSQKYDLLHIVLDETKNETLAYVSRWFCQYIFVYSLERNVSWSVLVPRIHVLSLALSPKDQHPRKLYISNRDNFEVYSILVAVLRNGTGNAKPDRMGKWTARPHKMLMDVHGTLYAAFYSMYYISSWNTLSQRFEEQRFHEVAAHKDWSFLFALDQNGTFWITVIDRNIEHSTYRILKEQSFEASPVTPFIPTTTTKRISWTSAENSATTEVLECIILKEKLHQCWRFIIFLLCSYVFTVIFLTSIIVLTQNRKNNALSRNTKEVHEMTIVRDKPNKEHEFPNNAYSRSFSPDLEAAEKAQYSTDEECESDYFEAVEF